MVSSAKTSPELVPWSAEFGDVTSWDANLLNPALQQPRQVVSRHRAEHILQQLHGTVRGIERMTDADLQKRIPTQYVISKP